MKKKAFTKTEKTSWIESKRKETKTNMETMIDQLLNSDNISGFLEKKLFKFPDTVPCTKWSMLNQFRMFMLNSMDCRGFKQWQEIGRHVKAGSKSAKILVPIFKEFPKTDDSGKSVNGPDGKPVKNRYIAYFKEIPVFKAEDTDGEPLDYQEDLDNVRKMDPSVLPLADIAESLNIPVKYDLSSSEFGSYSYRLNLLDGAEKKEIRLCTDAEQTFYHELSHAIDHILIGDSFPNSDRPLKEITAEFTACYLASVYGTQANMVYTRHYVRLWSGKKPPVDSLLKCLNRAVNIVMFIAERKRTADQDKSVSV